MSSHSGSMGSATMVTAGEVAGTGVASILGASTGGVSGAAAADLVCAAASFNALSTAGDSGETGAATGGCAVAVTGCIPFGVKLTSLALPSIVTEESVAVAMSVNAIRQATLRGYVTWV